MPEPTTDASKLDGVHDQGDPTTTNVPADQAEKSSLDSDLKKSSTGRLVVYAAVIAIVGALALTLIFSSSTDSPDAEAVQAEGFARFEDLTFITTEGESSNLGDFGGEPLVVNFFASWCAPCRAEMPHFESASIANRDEVKFLGINHDLDDSSWKAFVAETDVTFETVFQPQTEIWNEIEAKGMPTTAFVSGDGELVHVYTGVLDEPTLQTLIDEHLLET